MMSRVALLSFVFAFLAAAPQEQKTPFLKKDKRFPIRGVFSDTVQWGIRDATLVVWGGMSTNEWLMGWNLETGQQEYAKHVPEHTDRLARYLISPSGKFLFRVKKLKDAKYPTDEVFFIDSKTGRIGKKLKIPTSVDGFKFGASTEDERFLARKYASMWLSNGRCYFWKKAKLPDIRWTADTPDLRYRVGTDPARTKLVVVDTEKKRIAAKVNLPELGEYDKISLITDISKDGKTLILRTNNHGLSAVDLKRKKVRSVCQGHTDLIYALAVSPKGDRAMTMSKDLTVRIWDLKNGKELASHPIPQYTGTARFAGDGKFAVRVTSTGAEVFDAATGKLLRTVRTALSNRAAVSADASSAVDFENVTLNKKSKVIFWGLNPVGAKWEKTISGHIKNVRLSGKGGYAAAQVDKMIHVFDTAQKKLLGTVQAEGDLIGILPEGKGIVARTRAGVTAFEVPSGDQLWTALPEGRLHAVAMNAGGTHVAFYSDKPLLKVIQTSDGKVISGESFDYSDMEKAWLTGMAVSEDGQTVVGVAPQKQVMIFWSVNGTKKAAHFFPNDLRIGRDFWLSVVPDGSRAFCSAAGIIAIVGEKGGFTKPYNYTHTTSSMATNMIGDILLVSQGGRTVIFQHKKD